ncbi:uncharacterized protein JCM15063_001703 [Sporobolomyces koalae]|uniref:uncharacterized protein n=1 Tax=Sporobolomyces koalae TaxID=500713 RepID=UPI0031724D39
MHAPAWRATQPAAARHADDLCFDRPHSARTNLNRPINARDCRCSKTGHRTTPQTHRAALSTFSSSTAASGPAAATAPFQYLPHLAPTRTTRTSARSTLAAASALLITTAVSSVQAAPQQQPEQSERKARRQKVEARVIDLNYSNSPSQTPIARVRPNSSPSPTPKVTPASSSRRKILPKYEYSDGSYIIDTNWTLRGSVPSLVPVSTSKSRPTALQDNIDTIPPLSTRSISTTATAPDLQSSALAPPASTVTTPTGTPTRTPVYVQHAYASASDVPIPRGWQTRPRETDFYAVPVIIAMSVLVAIFVVGAILGSVCWRKKKRRRRDPEKDVVLEKGWRGLVQRATGATRPSKSKKRRSRKAKRPVRATEGHAGQQEEPIEERHVAADAQSLRDSVTSGDSEIGSGNRTPRIVRTTGFAAVAERSRPRWRNRRRSQVGPAEASDDEATALTRSDTRSRTSSSAAPRNSLTARIASRLHGPSSGQVQEGPSTVFSRMPTRNRSSSTLSNDPFPRTSTQDSHLTRSSSRSSLLGVHSPLVSPPTLLFTPADEPSLSPRPSGPGFEPLSLIRTASQRPLPPSPSLVEMPDPLASVPRPATSASSSFNALLSQDADLSMPLMPGPPAYRPASSTVQSTRRYGAGDSPAAGSSRLPQLVDRRRRHTRSEVVEEQPEQEWHWPGEKNDRHLSGGGAAALAGPSGSGPSSSHLVISDEVPHEERAVAEDVEEHDEEHDEDDAEEEPPVDRSMYQAHLATDDKAVLHRLRNLTYQDDAIELAGHDMVTSRSMLPTPSAPPIAVDDLDEDGFERFDPTSDAADDPSHEERHIGLDASSDPRNISSARMHQSSSTLPAPPSRSDFSYSYLSRTSSSAPIARELSTATTSTSKSALAAEYAALDPRQEDVELDLPMYLARDRRNEVLTLASAPPVLDEEDEEDEDVGVTHAVI